jgi:hypothetical protein
MSLCAGRVLKYCEDAGDAEKQDGGDAEAQAR